MAGQCICRRLWRSIKYEEVVCCERHRLKSERWRCFTGDEGRSLEVGLQEQASNRPVLLRSKGVVVSDRGKVIHKDGRYVLRR
jgi:hypothetical protein